MLAAHPENITALSPSFCRTTPLYGIHFLYFVSAGDQEKIKTPVMISVSAGDQEEIKKTVMISVSEDDQEKIKTLVISVVADDQEKIKTPMMICFSR